MLVTDRPLTLLMDVQVVQVVHAPEAKKGRSGRVKTFSGWDLNLASPEPWKNR